MMISRDPSATSLNIDSGNFGYSLIAQRGGLGNLSSGALSLSNGAKEENHQLFGETLPAILEELNTTLTA